MKKLLNVLKFGIFFVLGMILFSAPASAYIDPGAMTFIVSAITMCVVSAGAAFGYYFSKIKRKFKSVKDDAPKNIPVSDEVIEDNGEFDDLDDAEE